MPKNIKNIYMPDFTKGFIVTLFLYVLKASSIQSGWPHNATHGHKSSFLYLIHLN